MEEVVGHDFRKRKLLTQPHHIQNFASQSGLRPPHHGHDFRKRKLPLATAPSCAVSRSKHFATQNGLRPPRFLRGAYFAVHKRLEPNYNMLNLYNILIQVKNTIHANGVLIKI